MKRNRKIIYLAGFIFTIPFALTSYVNSSALETYISKNYIGLVYAAASLLCILCMMQMPRILTRYGNRATTVIFSSVSFISLLIMAFAKSGILFIPAFIIFFIATNFVIASLDIFIEDFSGSGAVGRLRGIYLSIVSISWVVALMMSGSIIEKSSFKGVYLYSAILLIPLIFIFRLFFNHFKDPLYKKIAIWKTIRVFARERHLSKIYLINLILRFFFTWMVIYSPIYLHEYLHFGWDQIGIILSIMLLPFVFLSFPLGRLSDRIGEKRLLLWGFFITMIFTLAIPLVHEPTLWIWATILFFTRVGAATVQVMSESYFFKEVNEEHADAIAFFRNSEPVAFLIAPLLAIPILIYVPSFEYIFFVLGAILLMGFFLTLRLKDVK